MPNPLPAPPTSCRSILRSSLRQLHLRQQQGGSAKWVLYDTRRGEEPVQDDAAAALLAGPDMPGEAAAGESPGPTVADSGSSTSPQQQRQRVWVGFIGGPPPAPASTPLGDGQLQQHVTRSPSKFASLSPARSPGPRKVLVS